MAVLGFSLGVILLTYLSSACVFTGLYGGEEFRPLRFKELWWYMPIFFGLCWLWYLLFAYSPFLLSVAI